MNINLETLKIKIYKIVIAAFTVSLICLLSYAIYSLGRLDGIVFRFNKNMASKEFKYHFAVILHDTDEPYWKEIESGIKNSAEKMNAYAEISYTTGSDEYRDTLKYIDMAISSKVDGIITHAYDTAEFSDKIGQAYQNGIPVVTIDTDCPKSKRISFIGTNDFELGRMAGKEVNESESCHGSVAIVMNVNDNKRNDNGSLIVSGFKSEFKNEDAKIKVIGTNDQEIIGAKDVLQKIINNNKDVDTIVCTSINDTIGIAQQLVDYNKVGSYTVLGYGGTDDILNYVKKGIVFKTLVPNSEIIGSKSMECMHEIKERGTASPYILTDINIVGSNNADKWGSVK